MNMITRLHYIHMLAEWEVFAQLICDMAFHLLLLLADLFSCHIQGKRAGEHSVIRRS